MDLMRKDTGQSFCLQRHIYIYIHILYDLYAFIHLWARHKLGLLTLLEHTIDILWYIILIYQNVIVRLKKPYCNSNCRDLASQARSAIRAIICNTTDAGGCHAVCQHLSFAMPPAPLPGFEPFWDTSISRNLSDLVWYYTDITLLINTTRKDICSPMKRGVQRFLCGLCNLCPIETTSSRFCGMLHDPWRFSMGSLFIDFDGDLVVPWQNQKVLRCCTL